MLAPGVRRAALALHVLCSVGWIGAAAAYLALGIAASTSNRIDTIRGAWFAMEITGWYVIVPLGITSLLTGLLMSLGTRWGLLRHYWVLIALILTSLSLTALVLHMPTVTAMADLARVGDASTVAQLGGDTVHPALGIGVLVVVAVLNIYKPRGLTRYGQSKQPQNQSS